MVAYKCDIHGNIKGSGIREIKIPDKTFGMDVFRAEEKKLSFFQHMSHIVIGTVPPVADKDIPGSGEGSVPVDHVTESPEFVLAVNGLDKGI